MIRADFNTIISKMSKILYGYAYRILENQQEAEDAVQETFLKLWKMNEKLENYDSVEALSKTMLKNYCIDQIRKRKSTAYENITDNQFVKVPDATPQELLERAETAVILRGIIEQLPILQREVINLRDIQGLSYDEISERSGQSVNNIRVILSRARKSVREEYIRQRDEDGRA